MTTRFLTVLTAIVFANSASAADVEFVLPGEKPVRVKASVETAPLDTAFAKLFAFCDLDGDGSLSETEAKRLPPSFAVRQIAWGQFVPNAGPAPAFADLDADKNGKLDRAKVDGFYTRAGVEPVLLSFGTSPVSTRLHDAIRTALDTDRDGKLSDAELKAAHTTLRKLDTNDDELVSASELVAGVSYPGTAASRLVPARRTKESSVLRLSAFSPEEVQKLPEVVPVAFTFGKEPRATTKAPSAIDVRADRGELPEQTAAARKLFLAQFAEADADRDGTATAAEAGVPKLSELKAAFPFADRNGDGKLTDKELAEWLDVQAAFAAATATVGVLDLGNGLFERIDVDHDGALSIRELTCFAASATAAPFDATKLPRTWVVVGSAGRPTSILSEPARSGPEWFRAMDRNRDGDVSRREFTGPAALFTQHDTDGDGLLSPEEAAKIKN